MRYANERLIEEMCKSRTVSFKCKWKKESVMSITNESLYQYYQKVLAEDEMDHILLVIFQKTPLIL